MGKSYIAIYNGNEEELKTQLSQKNLNNYIVLNRKAVAIYVGEDFDEEIFFKIECIYDWGVSTHMSSLIEINLNSDNGKPARSISALDYIEKNPYINPTGKGTIIAIIDSGIDYMHPDFIKKDGTSKIISIWDQDSDKGNPPEGLNFGSEFTSEQINEYISRQDSTLTEDDIGTGTLAAGIAVGLGNENFEYKGIATDSELIVVKLREEVGVYKEGRISYALSDFLAGIKYVIDSLKKHHKSLVINLTVASKSEGVVETTLLESFESLTIPGVIIVCGLGNEGNTDTHYKGNIKNINDVVDILIQVGEQKNLDIIVSCVGPDKINASLISPSGELSYDIKYSPDRFIYKGRFNIEKTNYDMRFLYPWLKSGTEEIVINLKDIKPGIWTLRLKAEFLISGEYDVFLPNKNLLDKDTRFINSNSFSTTTWFAATENVLSVGAYNNNTDSIWIQSSRGTLNQNPLKPDIVAPGVDIIGPYKNNKYAKGTGTGVSSSIISGVASVLMEYISYQSELGRNLLFTEVIKTYLMIGADRQDIYSYPNVNLGYGVLNFKKTMESIAENLR